MFDLRVLLFGPAATAAGAPSITLQFDAQPTCTQVLDRLAEAHPGLRQIAPVGRLAVNRVIAAPTSRIAPDDEVALIALVSGG